MKPPSVDLAPAAPGRRRFLQAGLAGAVLLATLPRSDARALEARPQALTTEHWRTLAAIVPVMLAGALPQDERRTHAVEAVLEGVERAVQGLPSHLQAEVAQLFSLLTFAPTRALVAGVWQPWSEASADSIGAFLQRWRTSWLVLLRSGYQALHELVMAAWYANPESWGALRYPGPPSIR